MKTSMKFIPLLLILALLSACGPTYVVERPPTQYDPAYYNPGYDPSHAVADAILTAAVINGVTGYYGPGGIFYRQAYYGGVPGYYVGGVFHTSREYHTTIVNNYNTGRNDYLRSGQITTYNGSSRVVNQAPSTAIAKPNYGARPASMPNYSNSPGGSVRSAPTSTYSRPTGMPNYSNSSGTSTRSAPTSSFTRSAPTTSSKPSYGSSSGTSFRSSPTTSTRSSSSSSSSSSRTSTRR